MVPATGATSHAMLTIGSCESLSFVFLDVAAMQISPAILEMWVSAAAAVNFCCKFMK